MEAATAGANGKPVQARKPGWRKSSIPYLLLLPGMAWLAIFFVLPLYYMARLALSTGSSIERTLTFDWAFGNFPDAVSAFSPQLGRSFLYAGIATVLCVLLAFPLAYFIAVRGGRWRNALLLAVILPFFATYLVRTLAWLTILDDASPVVDVLKAIGIVGDDGRVLATAPAVIAGLTYNFVPFMILPLYASLERLDRRLLEAAYDLYANRRTVFFRVTLPLSLPGLLAGTLLTFIPAAGDYVNAELLGNPQTLMLGNVVQSRYLDVVDYPTAAALAFVLMGAILLMTIIWSRIVGTEQLMGAAAR
jgi:spermidine/putrescine transport system permease protein